MFSLRFLEISLNISGTGSYVYFIFVSNMFSPFFTSFSSITLSLYLFDIIIPIYELAPNIIIRNINFITNIFTPHKYYLYINYIQLVLFLEPLYANIYSAFILFKLYTLLTSPFLFSSKKISLSNI